MNLKILIQIGLFLLATFLTIFIYNQYFKTKIIVDSNNLQKKSIESEKTKIKGNIIKDIVYESEDINGNVYVINSEIGEFNDEDQNIIEMSKVVAFINFTDGSSVKLQSYKAKYNISNNNTNFYKNVKMNYLNHNVSADNLDIYFQESRVEAYNNLVYRKPDLNLIADKVEINLLTKNSKIFMLNDDKVKIIKTN